MKFELNLPKYETKSDLKHLADVDTSDFAKNFDLTNSK